MSEPTIVTVRGPIPAVRLGVTLMHEHIFINQLREFRGDGLLNDAPLAVREVTRFRQAGGATVDQMGIGSAFSLLVLTTVLVGTFMYFSRLRQRDVF